MPTKRPIYDYFMSLPEPIGKGTALRVAYNHGVGHVKYGYPLIKHRRGSQYDQAQRAGVDRERAKKH